MEKKTALNDFRAYEIEQLNTVATNLHVSIEVIAVACYIATYTKNDNFSKGFSYGWLLFNELISVFTRNNKKYELYRLPKYAETVSVFDGYLYVNDKKYGPIENADNCEYVPVQVINGRMYAMIHKKSDVVVNIETTKDIVGKIYNLSMIYGFKYADSSKDIWKSSVSANGYNFKIDFDDHSRIVTKVNGNIIGSIKASVADISLHELVGHTVHITTSPNYEETESTIKNVVVKVVD